MKHKFQLEKKLGIELTAHASFSSFPAMGEYDHQAGCLPNAWSERQCVLGEEIMFLNCPENTWMPK